VEVGAKGRECFNVSDLDPLCHSDL
jgi:hypothetical protein